MTAELQLPGTVMVDWAHPTLAVSTGDRWFRLPHRWGRSPSHHRSNPACSNKDQNQSAAPSSVTSAAAGASVTGSLATCGGVVSEVGRGEVIRGSEGISVFQCYERF